MRPRLAAYGHSWVAGDSASSPERRLVNIAARILDMSPVNLGVSGSSSKQTVRLVRQAGVLEAEAYLFLAGLNDARMHGQDPDALDDYTLALGSLLDACTMATPGSLVLLIEQPPLIEYRLHPPYNRGSTAAIDAYNERMRQVATRYPKAVVVRVPSWNAWSMLAEDTVHPNDLGHRTIGVAVARVHQSNRFPPTAARP